MVVVVRKCSYYPMQMYLEGEQVELKDEDEFLSRLRGVLGSEQTRRVVEAIMAHAVALKEKEG